MRSAFYTKKPLKNLKYCIQRIRRGYCDADLWDIDSWFMSVIVPMLRQFDKTRFGWPTPIQEQYIEEHMAKYEAEGMSNKDAMKQVAKDRGVSKRDIYQYMMSFKD